MSFSKKALVVFIPVIVQIIPNACRSFLNYGGTFTVITGLRTVFSFVRRQRTVMILMSRRIIRFLSWWLFLNGLPWLFRFLKGLPFCLLVFFFSWNKLLRCLRKHSCFPIGLIKLATISRVMSGRSIPIIWFSGKVIKRKLRDNYSTRNHTHNAHLRKKE